jgi:hypothetical protein
MSETNKNALKVRKVLQRELRHLAKHCRQERGIHERGGERAASIRPLPADWRVADGGDVSTCTCTTYGRRGYHADECQMREVHAHNDFDFGAEYEAEVERATWSPWNGPTYDPRARVAQRHREALADVTTWKTWRCIGVWSDDGVMYESRNCPCCKPTRTFSLAFDTNGEPVPMTEEELKDMTL